MTDWHPRGNAFPVRWRLSNGRHGTPYGYLVWKGPDRFVVLTRSGAELGEFDNGDDAAVFAWEKYLERNRMGT